MVLAGIGLVLSVAAHLAALIGGSIPGGSAIWSLHIGIFVVWFPTVLVANRVTNGTNRKDSWRIVLSGCPHWMRVGLYGLFTYAIVNFIWFIASRAMTGIGKSVSLAHEVRGFSGHWMVFYGAACAVLYSVTQVPELLQKKICPNGHPVGVVDSFCATCGARVEREHWCLTTRLRGDGDT